MLTAEEKRNEKHSDARRRDEGEAMGIVISQLMVDSMYTSCL